MQAGNLLGVVGNLALQEEKHVTAAPAAVAAAVVAAVVLG